MTSTRMAMGAAVISCVSAAMMTGALAQENTTNGYFNARAGGNHVSAPGQLNGTGRQSERPAVSAHAHARIGGNHMMATGQPNGQRENETRSRGERREFYVGGGVAAAEYTYPRRLYAYAPGHDVGYRGRPFYNYGPAYGVTSYGPAYDVTVGADPSYAPAYDLAYSAGPYYDYAPGFNLGIGVGPVGIGIGPAWGW